MWSFEILHSRNRESWSKKDSMQQKERELIEWILGLQCPNDNRKSTAQLALQNAQYSMCMGNSLVALLLYLICLEQFGNILCKNDSDTNGIVKVLKEYFPKKFDDEQLKAIKNLRNSLCHQFGLAGNYKKKNKTHYYKFILSPTENQEAVICPKEEWNGSCDNLSSPVSMNKYDVQTSYQISIPSLIKIFDETINNIKEEYRKNKLNFVTRENQTIEQRLKEIEYNYFIYYS